MDLDITRAGNGSRFAYDSQEQLLLEGGWRDFVIREESSEGISFQLLQECKFSFEGWPGAVLCSANLHYISDLRPYRRRLNK